MLLGDYDAALTILESLGIESPCTIEQDREVLRAKARTWIARGYSKRARECMRKACALPWEKSRQQILMLEIHPASVTIVACGEEVEDDKFYSRLESCFLPCKRLHPSVLRQWILIDTDSAPECY